MDDGSSPSADSKKSLMQPEVGIKALEMRKEDKTAEPGSSETMMIAVSTPMGSAAGTTSALDPQLRQPVAAKASPGIENPMLTSTLLLQSLA
ncbi:hypothetical protein ROHU_012943 [Labeo rohita]|uniref:Uncharacterized protein n=1 Tax=Labeo rohita TaxID=84645 RepID=A0A498L8A2_LABRO|nr:hypothetical protein ROHU_012943 [Labeo rohita]